MTTPPTPARRVHVSPAAPARAAVLATALALFGACGGADYERAAWDGYDLRNTETVALRATGADGGPNAGADYEVADVGESTRSSARGRRTASRSEAASASAPAVSSAPPTAPEAGPGLAEPQTVVASGDPSPPLDADTERSLPLLIYTGQVVLAIYDVDATKEAAVSLAEELGGYAAQRTDHAVVIRVPAERFRAALDRLDDLGDVLSLTWDAQDVTDEFNDLDVRIRNARQMRQRLEALLSQAETVSDALAIERELERITLEIERLEGQRRQMVDRIAFATITITFSRLPTQNLPGDEYRLPFTWLNQLGVERLLNL